MQRTDLAQAGDPALIRRVAAVLHGLPHFEATDLALLESLVRRGTLVTLAPGDVLIREGDATAAEFYVLLDGALVVNSGGRQINRIDQPGEVVGELAVLQAPPRTADVVAESAARALAIRPELIGRPEFAGIAAITYKMLSHSLARKLRGMTARTGEELERVEREAATDPLTGLANRKRLDEFLADVARAAGSQGSTSLIMLDVDHFKSYNDTHGHPMGDTVLARLGAILQASIRSGDLAARYGGEEFAVVLPACDHANARGIAEKLRGAVERENFPGGATQPEGRVTATFGVSTQAGRVDPAALLRRADQALYRGKAEGRNRVVSAD